MEYAKVTSISTEFEGISLEYLTSLATNELDDLLLYLSRGEIDAVSFISLLLKETESMDEEEVQYWLDISPSITLVQLRKLMNILITEYNKLSVLEIKYQKEIAHLNEMLGEGELQKLLDEHQDKNKKKRIEL